MNLKIGIIGYGNHFKKNIEPVLKKLKVFSKENIFLKKKEEFFFKKKFDLVYISNQTKFHEKYIILCLKHNYNIMVEKPIVIRKENINKILKEARKKNLLLFECFMYRFHKVFIELKEKIRNENVKFVFSSFKFPGLNKNNFRYKKQHGGFFWDTAVYPLSLDIFLFNDKSNLKIRGKNFSNSKNIHKGVIIQNDRDVLKIYKWGEGQKYENNLEIICKNKTFYVNKIFSKLKNEKIYLEEISNGKTRKKVFIDNQFEKMFSEVFKKFRNKNFKEENYKYIHRCFLRANKIFNF